MHKILANLKLIGSASFNCFGEPDSDSPYSRLQGDSNKCDNQNTSGDGVSNFAGNGGCNKYYFDFFLD
jgi:hypothetical protein